MFCFKLYLSFKCFHQINCIGTWLQNNTRFVAASMCQTLSLLFIIRDTTCENNRQHGQPFFLTHWGRDIMAAISLMTPSNEFSWMKMLKFRLKFQFVPKGPINNIPVYLCLYFHHFWWAYTKLKQKCEWRLKWYNSWIYTPAQDICKNTGSEDLRYYY